MILDRPDDLDKEDPLRLTQTYLEQVNVNRDFREVADFFESVQYLHIVPQLIRDPDRSVGKTDDPFGGDFLEQVARTPEKPAQLACGASAKFWPLPCRSFRSWNCTGITGGHPT